MFNNIERFYNPTRRHSTMAISALWNMSEPQRRLKGGARETGSSSIDNMMISALPWRRHKYVGD